MNENNLLLTKVNSNENNDEDDDEDDDYRPSAEESEDKGDVSEDEESDDNKKADETNVKKRKVERKTKKQRNKQIEKRLNRNEQHDSSDDDDEDDYEDNDYDDDSMDSEKKHLNEIELKKKSDELWASLMSSVKQPSASSSSIASQSTKNELIQSKGKLEEITNPDKDDQTKIVVTKVFEFAGEEVHVNEEIDAKHQTTSSSTPLQSDGKSNNNDNSDTQMSTVSSTLTAATSANVKRGVGGIGNLLANFSKKPKLNTLTKTQLDWNLFKKSEGIEEELQQHVKSKDGFIERQAFLQRADLRQFELEKQVRERNRLSKS